MNWRNEMEKERELNFNKNYLRKIHIKHVEK